MEAAQRIAAAIGALRQQRGGVVAVAIDGRGGSGKSTIAAALASLSDACLVHTDDFFKPMSPEQRANLVVADGVGPYYDVDRLRSQAVNPLLAGSPASFRRYDWELGSLSPDTTSVQARQVVVLEGVDASGPELEAVVDLSVLIDTAEEDRLARLRARISPADWDWQWLEAEDAYFTKFRPPSWFELVLES